MSGWRMAAVAAVVVVGAGIWVGAWAAANKLVNAKDGSGTMGYKHTPVQPWSGYHVHDPDRPLPPKVDPGQMGKAPSDAIILFDGTDLSQWRPNKYRIEDGLMVATEGPMATVREFGSVQLHLEWQQPVEPGPNVMNQGNNGVFFGGGIEVQIFDSYRVKLYPDGQAASIYAQTPPLVNACRQPGEWEVYDIIYIAPKFDAEGRVVEPARITMFHNGILVHHNQEVYGSTPHLALGTWKNIRPRAPIALGAHGCPIRFRNVWARPLDGQP
jgi:hypothetical protein